MRTEYYVYRKIYTRALTVPITLPGAELLMRTVTLVKPVAKEKTFRFS